MEFQVQEREFQSSRLGVNSRRRERAWKQKVVVPYDKKARMFCRIFQGDKFQGQGIVRRCFFIGKVQRFSGKAFRNEKGDLMCRWFQHCLCLVWVEELGCMVAVRGDAVEWFGAQWDQPAIEDGPWKQGQTRRLEFRVHEDYIDAEKFVLGSNFESQQRQRNLPQLWEGLKLAAEEESVSE